MKHRLLPYISIVCMLFSLFSAAEPSADFFQEKLQYYESLGYKPMPAVQGNTILSAGKYICIDNLDIPAGNILTLTPQATLYMEPEKRISLQGTLRLLGDSGEKAKICSVPKKDLRVKLISDTRWNGINAENAEFTAKFAVLKDMKLGIQFSAMKEVMLQCVSFINAGSRGIHLNDHVIIPSDTTCVSYTQSTFQPDLLPTAPGKEKIDKHSPLFRNLLLVGGAVAAVGVGGAVIFNALEDSKVREGEKVEDRESARKIDDELHSIQSMKKVSFVLIGAGVVTAGTMGVFLVFDFQ